MEISSDYVGSESKPFEQVVSWRHAMNFAAAVDDYNPHYFDDEREGGIVVPPLLAVSITWPFCVEAETHWDATKFPLHLLDRQVHYTETIEFHRLMRPADRLTLQARILAMKPHRAGTLMHIKVTAVDEKGNPVFTETSGTMLRDVTCTGGAKGQEDVPDVPRITDKEGTHWEGSFHVGPMAAHVYDGAADIHNPIHTSPKFAKAVGLPGIIVHGTYTLAVATREILNRIADGDPARLKTLSCRFTGMVIPDSDILVRIRSAEPGDGVTNVFFEVINAEGRKAVSFGHAAIAP